jgi:hypothetical protein
MLAARLLLEFGAVSGEALSTLEAGDEVIAGAERRREAGGAG